MYPLDLIANPQIHSPSTSFAFDLAQRCSRQGSVASLQEGNWLQSSIAADAFGDNVIGPTSVE
jgi:hypothetical protein